MKQSLRAWLPQLGELLPLSEAVAEAPPHRQLVAYLGEASSPLLRQACPAGISVNLYIGPEGGFSPAEAAHLQAAGATYVSLGPHRLRTETAAIVAVHTVEQLNWSVP